MSTYSYLFKYIIIGDTSIPLVSMRRCWEIVHFVTVFGEKI